MSDIKKMIKYFGDSLPSPINYPKTFKYYIKLYKHFKEQEQKGK